MKVTVNEEIEIIAFFLQNIPNILQIYIYMFELSKCKWNFYHEVEFYNLLYNFISAVHVLIKIYAIVSREKYKKIAIVSRILNLNNIN